MSRLLLMRYVTPARFELAVLIIVAVAVAYQIFIPPLIGLADSGDFERLLPDCGLAHISNEYNDKYFLYFNSKYQIVPRTEARDLYKSSTVPLIDAGKWIGSVARDGEIFDIRFLAALYFLIFLAGVALILACTRSLDLA